MTLSNDELSAIRANLVALHQAASSVDGWDGKRGQTFIEVGEYGLALDEIAYAYLDGGKTMPAELFNVFEKLASMMELEKEPEYEGVARLQAITKAHPA